MKGNNSKVILLFCFFLENNELLKNLRIIAKNINY